MPLADEILRLTLQRGLPEERQLLSRWQAELRRFLGPFERELRQGQQALEVGLETGLTLKLVIKRRTLPPAAGLLRLAEDLPPPLRDVAVGAATAGLDFHVGIRFNPDSAHREIYLYDRGEQARALLPRMPSPPDGLRVTAYGIDERQGISAYCTSDDNIELLDTLRPQQQALNALLKIDLSGEVNSMWLHYRLHENRWQRAKYGMEYRDVPLNATMRVLSHFKLPYFSYLIPRQPLRQMVIGGTAEGDFRAFYFTVL